MPLLFDMPLDKLHSYQGINPKPQDFDRFWDDALLEMQSVDADAEQIPDGYFDTPFAACSHLWFTGVGGARIHAKLLEPTTKSTEKHPALLQFHGYAGSSGDWMDKLGYAAAGFTVAVMDCRGQGGLSQDRGGIAGSTLNGHIIRGLEDSPEKLLFRQIFLDTARLAGVVMSLPQVDPNRIGVMGGSQGGGLGLACAALEPRIRKLAVRFPFLSDYQRVWNIDQAKDAYGELKEFFRRNDPLHRREAEIFTRLGYIDVQHLAPRIRADVLMAAGLMDTVCPPSTQFAAYNKIPSKKSLCLYPDFGHETLPGFADETFLFFSDLL